MTTLVVGVDAGGTTTRCVVAAPDGTVLGRGRSGGANPRSATGDPTALLTAVLTAALRAALAGIDVSRVAGGVVGMAGAGRAGHAMAAATARSAWRSTGLPGEVTVVTDLEVGFAAGAPDGSGLLLAAGTGAVAAALRDGVVVHRCDGYGWLVGDEGSAVWLGRQALRAVLASLDGRAGPTALTATVTAALCGAVPVPDHPGDHAQALVAAAYARPPAALGRLAPLVSAAATAGDPVAASITGEAARHLLHALDTVARAAPDLVAADLPIVVTGAVLLSPGPVSAAVHAEVHRRFGVVPRPGGDGAAGAACLALARLSGHPVGAAVLARLRSG